MQVGGKEEVAGRTDVGVIGPFAEFDGLCYNAVQTSECVLIVGLDAPLAQIGLEMSNVVSLRNWLLIPSWQWVGECSRAGSEIVRLFSSAVYALSVALRRRDAARNLRSLVGLTIAYRVHHR